MVALRDMLTTSEAARAAGVADVTVRSWLKSGRLPYQDTKHGALINPVALGKVIAEREAEQRERAVKRGH